MAREKTKFTKNLTECAKGELEHLIKEDKIGKIKVAKKLYAIVAATKNPIETVAKIFDVTPATLWRWGKDYNDYGIKGLYTQSKEPKGSKLTQEQKAEVLSWIRTSKTAESEDDLWTLEKLRTAIAERFGVTLGINTIWAWLKREGVNLKWRRDSWLKRNNKR